MPARLRIRSSAAVERGRIRTPENSAADRFRFMSVTIIAQLLSAVNRKAIVSLTLHQKYYGLKLLYMSARSLPQAVSFVSGQKNQPAFPAIQETQAYYNDRILLYGIRRTKGAPEINPRKEAAARARHGSPRQNHIVSYIRRGRHAARADRRLRSGSNRSRAG